MLHEIKQKVKTIPQNLWDKNQLVDQGMRYEKPNVGHTAIDSDHNNDMHSVLIPTIYK